ncbi:hypothetical protein Leryth_026556 [Lithospermum erythrorhizon]|uniref:Uncharacterized protein n=1 Tax=Lithospermum erythrorhizon TaxID=34254 RepID=A0AAV3RZZ5_LITER|nr:hypothetical protein Leryth_026556 [Lithospermum erythrorhizon]
MEEHRESDYRVPMIAFLFLLLLISGGIFLILYCFVPRISQPWFPIAALALIGLPWIFWFMTYIYTCIKGCIKARNQDGAQIGRIASSMAASNNARMERNLSVRQGNGGVLSVTSSRECEVPLNASRPSS